MAPGHRLSPITSTSKNVPLNAPPVSCWHFRALKDNFLVLQVLMLSMWEHKRMVIDNFSKTRIKGSMLQVNHIRLSYGPRLVLDDVSFTVAPGEKAGLIGVNGAGKSSLLERFERAQNELDRLGYYDADARAEQLISGLEVGGVTLERYVSTLSGGQKTKLALVRLLFQAPDLLLLDEPTNFLDVEATAWLMDFLERYSGAILIISHDLDLLDRGINKVLRLNEFTHKLEEFRGTYSNYMTQTGDALALMERTKKVQEREIARLRKTSDKLRGFGATRVSQRIAIDKRVATLEASMPKLPRAS